MDNMKDMILEAVEMNGIENVVMPLMNEIFLSFTDIAGTRYVDNQDVFKKLEKNDPLLLEREADNKYDSNAIKVLTIDGEKLGYIPKRDNSIFTRLMDSVRYFMQECIHVIKRIMILGMFLLRSV